MEYEQSDESETNIYFFWRYDERNKQNQVKPQLVLKSTKKSIAPTKISGSLKGHCGFFLEVGLTFIDDMDGAEKLESVSNMMQHYTKMISRNREGAL